MSDDHECGGREGDHQIVSRRGKPHGPVDERLAELGLKRRVVGTGGTFPASLFVPRDTGLIGYWTVPPACVRELPGEEGRRAPASRFSNQWDA